VDKKPLIVVSLCAVVLLVLGSLSNVLGSVNSQSCDCGDPPCWPELSGRMGENNWYVSYVTVTFNDSFYHISYRINGSNWINYTKPFTLKTQGIHLLEWTCDSNMSNISSLEIKIDLDPPILSNYTSKQIGLFRWQFSVEAFDEFSGVNRVWCFWGFPHNYDTEPPYQFISIGFLRIVSLLLSLLTPWVLYMTVNAWDNAGNYWAWPS
jgi:hypothetical protein